jgi:hypothetical protein
MIGAYGNSWIQTPAFDFLSVQSAVFDRYYASSVNLSDNFNLLWGRSWLEQFSRDGGDSFLVTDDSDIFNHADAFFTRKYMIDSSLNKLAETADETIFFKIFATIIDIALEQLSNRSAGRYCIWAHLRGFRGDWDFPISYRERHRDKEDPPSYLGYNLPTFEKFDPDELQSVIESYSGGVSLLDDMLAGLLESIDSGELGGQTALAIFGVRGFSLGEHERIGANDELFGENIHLPLIVRLPDQVGATVRGVELLNPDDLADFFISVTKNRQAESNIVKLAEENEVEQRNLLKISGIDDEVALVTQNWFVRKKGNKIKVYVKPDDRWEVNDVSNRLNENDRSEINSILENSNIPAENLFCSLSR